MTVRCIDPVNGNYPITAINECPVDGVIKGPINEILAMVDKVGLISYAESGQLFGAVALLFSLAFILRSVRKQMGF